MICKNSLNKIVAFNSKLDMPQKIIRNLIIAVVINFLIKLTANEQLWKGVFILTLVYWTISVFQCLINVYKKIYKTTLGKGVVILGSTLCLNFALCLSGVVINDITSVSPTNFPHSLIFISIAMIPLIIPLGMIFLLLIILMTFPVWGWFFVYDEKLKQFLFPGYEPNNKRFLHKTTLAIQIFSIVIYCAFIFKFALITGDDYISHVNNKSKWLIYSLEMFEKKPCLNIEKGKVAFISDDNVLVATKDNDEYSFKVMQCEIK
ncbi:hypothetical protein RF240_22120 [Dickeya dadantii]|uniref:hypothetical protein n=1 Tax=Dickeya dadantii TaxID=204038 RepID=UPI0035A81CD5